jgi:hypothetical protein
MVIESKSAFLIETSVPYNEVIFCVFGAFSKRRMSTKLFLHTHVWNLKISMIVAGL